MAKILTELGVILFVVMMIGLLLMPDLVAAPQDPVTTLLSKP